VTSPNTTETPTEAVTADKKSCSALDALLDVSVPVVIEFGRTSMMLQDVLELQPGSVIQLDRTVGEPVDIFVSDRKLAAGEVVVVDDRFGIQITDILADRNGGAKE
jgi:flagellar motor switch protein FliN/FliY